MSSRSLQLLSSVFSVSPQTDPQRFVSEFMPLNAEEAAEPASPPKRRSMIWDLHHSTHCSIIGTCLSTAELRRLLIKLNVTGADGANDHDLHMLGVMLASRPDSGAKVLQKTLDRRHEVAIKQFARAKDTANLCIQWEEALKRGDIPGAYWAALTHPAADEEVVKRVFGDVHMLSHLVGAANRADIRRLRILEEENAALTTKLERQQRQLRDGFVERDAAIRRLNAVLAYTIARAEVPFANTNDYAQTTKGAMADLDRRLNQEIVRRERLETRIEVLTGALRSAEQGRERAEHQCRALAGEMALVEDRIGCLFAADEDGVAQDFDISGLVVLYVGGRANQVPQLKALVERSGGDFLHHDGGVEQSLSLLPGLISRADWTLFPVDCVSHNAMGVIKRVCRQSGKQFLPLRTSSLTCLFSELLNLSRAAVSASSE
jgi:Uncharacterized protein conserved in bacteria (DUF2325)